ncbi:hypothetical protein Tco_0282576, partial [Tanacetum coccineum]
DELEEFEVAPQSPRQAPPSLDYVSGPEHPPSPDYVPGPEEPEQASLSSDYPLPDDALPTALSPGYVADSDSEDYQEEDPEEDPSDYPADGGDDDDDESSYEDDDDDDEEEQEEQEASKDDNEEEEHQTPADSSVVPVDDHVPSTPMSAATEALIAAVAAALPSSPPSPLTPVSSPLPQIPSPPLPLPSPPTHTSPTYVEVPLGYRPSEIRLRAASPPTHHPSKILSPPLFEVGESSSAAAARQARQTLAHRVDCGFIDTMDASICAAESRAVTTVGVVNERVTYLATTQRQETHELQVRCEDAHDDRALLGAQVSILIRERRYFWSMASSYEYEAVISRQAWAHSKSRSQAMEKMPPKRTVTTTTTALMTNAAIKQLIAQRVADALAEIKANRTSRNSDESHDSGTGSKRTERAARECTYSDFLK